MNEKTEKPIILIVDDEPMVIKVAEKLLKNDYTTITANNGKEGLILATSHPKPDLIILDIMMPEMDGYEVCRQLKADKRSEDIPVFFLSSVDRTTDQMRGFELGAVEYIAKPFNSQLLKARISSHIELKKNRDYLREMLDNKSYSQEKTDKNLVSTQEIDTSFYINLLLVITLVLCISCGIYITEVNTLQVITKNDERNTIEQEKKVIENELTDIFSDLKIIAGSTHLHEMFERYKTHPRSQLSEELRKFCFHKKIYDQVRFLDQRGMEVIRVNYNDGNPFITPDDTLQFKGKRYYVTETFKLSKNEIFVSPFDLNIEHGVIETPIKPMIRFGTPVFNTANQKKGIILFNYLGGNLLNTIANIAENKPGEIMLLNSQGYFLKSPNRDDEWGFMYKGKRNNTFGNKFKKAWEKIASEETGQFEDQDGLFTFTTIRPWSHKIIPKTTVTANNIQSQQKVKSGDLHWTMVSHVTKRTLLSQTTPLMHKLLIIDIIITFILGSGLWFIASTRARRKAVERSLKISEKRLSELFDNMGSGVVIYYPSPVNDEDFLITDINKRTEYLEKQKKESVVGQSKNLIFPEILDAGLANVMNRVWETNHAEFFPVSVYEEEKLKRFLECYIYKLPSDELVVVYEDVTDRKKAEEEAAFEYALNEASGKIATVLFTTNAIDKVSTVLIKEARNLTDSKYGFTAFIDSDSDALIFSGFTGNIRSKGQKNSACPMFNNANGLMQQIMDSKKPIIINSTDELWRFDKMPESHISINQLIAVPTILDNKLIGLIALANTDKNYHEKDLKILEHLASLFALSVQQYEAEQKIRYLAHHDPLTGLANRHLFSDRLNQAIAASRRNNKKAAFLYIDLDDFKPINDTLGHKAGDSVLKEVAERLNIILRETDTVCRIGGDEFIIILKDLEKKADAGNVAEKIINSLSQPFNIESSQCVIGASIGISLYPDDGQDADSIQRNADTAMYRIKETSKNAYAYYEDGEQTE